MCIHTGFPGGSVVKNLPANAGPPGDMVLSLVRRIPWRRKWQVTPGFLPGESHGQEPGGLQSMGSKRVEYS